MLIVNFKGRKTEKSKQNMYIFRLPCYNFAENDYDARGYEIN